MTENGHELHQSRAGDNGGGILRRTSHLPFNLSSRDGPPLNRSGINHIRSVQRRRSLSQHRGTHLCT